MPEMMAGIPADFTAVPPTTFEQVHVGDFVRSELPGRPVYVWFVIDVGPYIRKADGTIEKTPDDRIHAKLVHTTDPKSKPGEVISWPRNYEVKPTDRVFRAPSKERAVAETVKMGGAVEKVEAAFVAPTNWGLIIGIGAAALLGIGALVIFGGKKKAGGVDDIDDDMDALGEEPEAQFLGQAPPEEQFIGGRRRRTKLTKAARRFISAKISKLHREGYRGRRAVAIAHDMARKAGYRVPKVAGI